MKFVIKKKIDGLGRMVLPKSVRECYGIGLNEEVVLIPINNGILITKGDNSNLAKENVCVPCSKEDSKSEKI